MADSPKTQRTKYGEEDAAKAYRLQVMGAREGAIKGTLVAGTLMLLANWRFPLVRRQTLAGKAFLTMWGTIFGMSIYSDKYLIAYEQHQRASSERWRNRARQELSAQGTIPTESLMMQWKAKRDAELRATLDGASSPVAKELADKASAATGAL